MSVLCNTCQGSGRMVGQAAFGRWSPATACSTCLGRGYRNTDRREGSFGEVDEVARVLDYDRVLGGIQVRVEETLHRGDRLLARHGGSLVEFEAQTLIGAGMHLEMAIRGWLVTILAPHALPAGAWIMRQSMRH